MAYQKKLVPHTQRVDDKVTLFYTRNSPFSNFYTSTEFILDYVTYTCGEQAFQHKKALLFNNTKRAKAIMLETNPLRMKKLGKKIRNFNKHKWSQHREHIMKKIVKAKFSDDPFLKRLLFETEPTLLVEASKYEKFWGCGWNIQNAIKQKHLWTENKMGLILTDVRTELRIEEATAEAAKNTDDDEEMLWENIVEMAMIASAAEEKEEEAAHHCSPSSSPPKMKYNCEYFLKKLKLPKTVINTEPEYITNSF